MKTQEVLNCSFSSWYPVFKSVTIKSRILDLSKDVLEYLLSDGTLVLPEGSQNHNVFSVDDSSDDEEQIDWEAENTAEEAACPSFPEFETAVKRSIKALGGAVFPKLNWSSPKDATWISCTNTLKCTTSDEIYLLLKSSEFVTHDLMQPFNDCSDFDPEKPVEVRYQLILRRWHDLNPGGEFRCFVRKNRLIGICQRHHSSYYPFIKETKDDIQNDIINFYNRAVKGKFPNSDFAFDVYRKDKEKVYLVDFNPFGCVTDGLLFTHEELLSKKTELSENAGEAEMNLYNQKPEIRIIEKPDGVQPSPYAQYGMPLDFIDLTTGSDPHKLMDLLQLKIQSQSDESSSDDEDEVPQASPSSNS